MSNRNKFKFIIVIISIVLSLTGVVVWGTLQNNNNKLEETTVIKVNGETNKTLKSEIKGFYPGKTADYVILFSGKAAQEYSISLNFFGDNGVALKKHIIVGISTKNGTIEKPLEELLAGELINLGRGITDIKITYKMPIDTGDEAQGASISFCVELSAKYVE